VAPSLPLGARGRRRLNGWVVSASYIPREAAARKLKESVLIGELYLDRIYQHPAAQDGRPRHLAFSAGAPVIFHSCWTRAFLGRRSIRRLQPSRFLSLWDWRVREVFREARLGANDYALLLGTTFQAPDRTLREEDLQSFQARVVAAVWRGRCTASHITAPPGAIGDILARKPRGGGHIMSEFSFEN